MSSADVGALKTLSRGAPEQLVATLRRDGIVGIQAGLDAAGVSAASELSSWLAVGSYEALRDRLAKQLLAPPASRGPHRWDFPLQLSGLPKRILDSMSGWLGAVLESYFAGPAWLSGSGLVASFPGAPFGYLHQDGPDPAGEFVTLFVPLQSVAIKDGPTEYWLQSQHPWPRAGGPTLSPSALLRHLRRRASLYSQRSLPPHLLPSDLFGAPPKLLSVDGAQLSLSNIRQRCQFAALDLEQVAATCSLGEVYLADYRTIHRGTANRSAQARCIFYFVFGRNPKAREPNWKLLVPERYQPEPQRVA